MLHSARWVVGILLLVTVFAAQLQAQQQPNVLFIAVDDLSDWVSVFGGHPQAQTPNIDRFAGENAVVFQNAHCPGPVCRRPSAAAPGVRARALLQIADVEAVDGDESVLDAGVYCCDSNT